MESFIVWYFQQSWFVIVGLPLSITVTSVGLCKTVFPSQSVDVIEDDLHNGPTERLTNQGKVLTPNQEEVSELAAEVFNDQNEFGDEFGEEQSYQNATRSPQYSQVIHPRYPTQPLPVQARYKVYSIEPQPQYVRVRQTQPKCLSKRGSERRS